MLAPGLLANAANSDRSDMRVNSLQGIEDLLSIPTRVSTMSPNTCKPCLRSIQGLGVSLRIFLFSRGGCGGGLSDNGPCFGGPSLDLAPHLVPDRRDMPQTFGAVIVAAGSGTR